MNQEEIDKFKSLDADEKIKYLRKLKRQKSENGKAKKSEELAVLPLKGPLSKRAIKEEAEDTDVLASVAKPKLSSLEPKSNKTINKQHNYEYIGLEKSKYESGFHPLYWVMSNPVRLLVFSFLFLIIIGALLLSLPIASTSGEWTNYFTSLFTATSATCVTGLILVDTGTYWTFFGKTVIILLIQLGGIGIITTVASFYAISKRRININTLRAVQDSLGSESVEDVYDLAKFALRFSLSSELIGGLILGLAYVRYMPKGYALIAGLFQGVSAFCNAGFDILSPYFGEFASLSKINQDPIILLVSAILITMGGIGFIVWREIKEHFKKDKNLSFHSKLVLSGTAAILVVATVLIFILERNNTAPASLGRIHGPKKALAALFQANTLRTAGFNSIDQANLTSPGKIFSIIVMFIGASPLSTGGGMKLTTATVVFAAIPAIINARDKVVIGKHQISKSLVYKAYAVFTLFTIIIVTSLGIISISEAKNLAQNNFTVLDLLYEVVSALCTVGLTSIGTYKLTTVSHIVLILCMFMGRVGPYSLAVISLSRGNKTKSKSVLPQGKTYIA